MKILIPQITEDFVIFQKEIDHKIAFISRNILFHINIFIFSGIRNSYYDNKISFDRLFDKK